MHTLPGRPSVPVRGDLGDGRLGVVGLQVPRRGTTVELYPGARRALRMLATDPAHRGIILAAASTSLEPSYSDACLRTLEVLPGLTVGDMLSYRQIGRSGRLNSDKRTHFRFLHEESTVPHEEMLFFDDCNWYECTNTHTHLLKNEQLVSIAMVDLSSHRCFFFPSFFPQFIRGDHVGTVNRAYGVVGQRTPEGLTFFEFEQGLERYRKHAQQMEAGNE